MALSRVKNWIANEVLTASDLNAEFNSILNNALSLISPLTANLNCNLKQLTSMLMETVSSTQSAATEGRLMYQSTEDQIHVDDGTNIRRVPTIASVTRGSIIRGSSTANVMSQLAIGAASTILTSDGTDPAWSGTPTIATEDARTNTVARPVTIQATTSGSPAAEIGTGILLNAESGDENPSNVAAIDGVFTDVGAGTEDSVLSVRLRVAGRALDEKYRLASTAGDGFTATLTHANTADRTYTLPDAATVIGASVNSVVTDLTSGDITEATGSMVNATGLSAALTLPTGTSGKVLVTATVSCANSDAAGGGEFDIKFGSTTYLFGDGSTGIGFLNQGTGGATQTVTLSRVVTGLAAATHTFQMIFRRTSAGTLTVNGTAARHSTISAVEL